LGDRLLLGLQLLIASELISDQRLQCIDVVGQLMQRNRHAKEYTEASSLTPYKTLE